MTSCGIFKILVSSFSILGLHKLIDYSDSSGVFLRSALQRKMATSKARIFRVPFGFSQNLRGCRYVVDALLSRTVMFVKWTPVPSNTLRFDFEDSFFFRTLFINRTACCSKRTSRTWPDAQSNTTSNKADCIAAILDEKKCPVFLKLLTMA